MNTGLIVIVSLAFPLLWLGIATDRQSYHEAIKLRESITEILSSISEWENGKLPVIKIILLKAYPSNLTNRLRLIRGYLVIRFVTRLPRKRNIHAASALLEQFCESIWVSAPGFRPQAEVMAQKIRELLR
jgi:hypothetical protein